MERDKKEFGRLLEKRTKDCAVAVIRLLEALPKSDETRVVKNQLIRSITSVGANYREANRGRSAADFRNKIRICEGEASESIYWLEIILDLDWLDHQKAQPILNEVTEILAIFSSVIRSMNAKTK